MREINETELGPPEIQQQVANALADVRSRLEANDVAGATAVLVDLHPADRADVFRQLEPSERRDLMKYLSAKDLGEVFGQLSDDEAYALANEMELADLSRILDEAGADVAADVLHTLPPAEAAQVLRSMAAATKVSSLMLYPGKTAGGLMTPEFVALRAEMTTDEALHWLKSFQPKEEVIYDIFVVDKDDRLEGVLSLPKLVLASEDIRLGELMDPDVVYVEPDEDQEDAARLMEHYDLVELPVVDTKRRLLGVITVDNLVDVIDQEATEDMYRMVGVPEEERALSPVPFSIKKRLPWLFVNLLTAFLAAAVVSLFEETIARFALLAVFMPVIAGQSGVAATQSTTVAVRSLALGELSVRDLWRALRKEALTGLVCGVAIGVVVAFFGFLWKGHFSLAIIVGVAMLLDMAAGAVAGVLIPLGFRLLKIDPALVSVVFVTTVTDVCGFFFFLGLATLFIGLLT